MYVLLFFLLSEIRSETYWWNDRDRKGQQGDEGHMVNLGGEGHLFPAFIVGNNECWMPSNLEPMPEVSQTPSDSWFFIFFIYIFVVLFEKIIHIYKNNLRFI